MDESEEPTRRHHDRLYRERHREELRAKSRERARIEREKARAWDREHGNG
jgi:hypothetical protein